MGVGGLGGELQRKAICRQSDWGAKGIVSALINSVFNYNSDKNIFRDYMLREIDDKYTYSSSRTTLTSDASVQTIDTKLEAGYSYQAMTAQDVLDQDLAELSASDMASIIKWSSAIASDINLSSGEHVLGAYAVIWPLARNCTALQRLTEIASGKRQSYCRVSINLFASLDTRFVWLSEDL